MKAMMGRFVFKPRDLKVSCDDESWGHKVKIVAFSVAMASVATTYQSYFNNLVYRSGMYQQRALSGQESFENFRDGEKMQSTWWNGETLFDMKIKLDILDQKDFKQLKFMQAGWKDTTSYEMTKRTVKTDNGSYQELWKRPVYTDANGLSSDANGFPSQADSNTGYYTQTLFMDGETETYNEKLAKGDYDDHIDASYLTNNGQNGDYNRGVESDVRGNILSYDEARWSEWETMHDGTIWFDTGACMQGKFIGDVNGVAISPTTPQMKKWARTCSHEGGDKTTFDGDSDCDIYQDASLAVPGDLVTKKDTHESDNEFTDRKVRTNQEETGIEVSTVWWNSITTPHKLQYDDQQQQIMQAGLVSPQSEFQRWNAYKGSDPVYKADASTDISVSGKMDWTDEDLYRDLLEAQIDLAEDCDIDCQKNGSQLTLIAGLMGMSYGFVALNALFMFIGTWRYRWRVCSVYCTFATCLFQFIILIVSGALLFTKYNAVCGRSMTKTAGDAFLWTMADDFYTTFSLWIISFVAMFCFVCCGLCSAYRPDK